MIQLLLSVPLAGGVNAPLYPVQENLIVWNDLMTLSTLWQDSLGTSPVIANNDPIARIDDRIAGNGYWQTGTAGFRFRYHTLALNGKPGAKADGTDDVLQRDTFLSKADMSESTVFSVVSGWVSGGYQGLIGANLAVNSDSYYLRISNADEIELLEAGIVLIATSTAAISKSAGAIIVAQVSDVGNSYAMQSGRLPVGSGAWTGAFANNCDLLGAQLGTPEYYSGYFHEKLVYPRQLSAGEIAHNVAYLGNRWRVS